MLPSHPRLVVADKPYEKVACLYDLHIPFHDPDALQVAFEIIRDYRPDLILLGGDVFDCKEISDYEQEDTPPSLTEEIQAGRYTLHRINTFGCDVVYLLGNHEERFERAKRKARLKGGDSLAWAKVAEIPERWRVCPNQTHYRVGPVTFLHGDLKGDRKSAPSVNLASRMLARLKTSCVFGHHHRSQLHFEPSYDGQVRKAMAVGHMSDIRKSADYLTCPDWVQGFALVDIDHRHGLHDPRPVQIFGGRAQYDGRTYGA